jgi:outer membrane protein TolC
LGVTTSFQVLEVESDLTLARTQHIQAQVNYQKALADLRLAEGALLDTFGIEFEAPEAEKPVSYFRSILPVPVK